MSEKNDIEDLFKNAFRDYGEDVSGSVWEKIECELHPAKKKLTVVWRWLAAASFAGAVTVYSLLPEAETVKQITEVEKPEKKKNTEEITENKSLSIKNDAEPNTELKKKFFKKQNITENNIVFSEKENLLTEKSVLQKISPLFSELKQQNSKELALVLYKEPPVIPFEKTEKQHDWTIAANMLSSMGAEGGNASERSEFAMQNKATYDMASESSAGKIEYFPPLITSITAHYQLSKRWGIESGISYSMLKAKRGNTFEVQLNYLGIPLLSAFKIIQRKKLSFYSAQGILFEVKVSSKLNSEKINFSNRPMGSLLLGIGLNYKISKRIGFYLQPDMAVYFLRPHNAYNVRSARIFWPTLQTGLRFHL